MNAVLSYKVGVVRSHKPGPSRWLSLKLEAASQGVSNVTLFFAEKEAPHLGYLNTASSCLVVNLPFADFAPSYQILNTEKPVYVHFRIHGDEHRLLSFDLSTSEEPVGEGPSDTSF